ncbi:MAG: lanthionine synthetase LanC family protein [Terracidiphilus sp.]|jgi:serine/threonine-protein kinase
MEITGTLVMAADTILLPVDQLSEELRRKVQADAGDYAVTRPNSRTLARIVDANSAKLLEEFRQPSTVVQAVIRYCDSTKEDPESILDGAFPMLERLVHAQLLVPIDSLSTKPVSPLLQAGSTFAGNEVVACLQALEDTRLYRVKDALGNAAALKVMRSDAGPELDRMFDRETFILKHLDASVTPALLDSGNENELRYLLLSWCPGSDCTAVAARFRSSGDRAALLRMSLAILDAYAHLHGQNVIHSDIHPRNILVDEDCSVRLVDFGLARIPGIEGEFRRSQRGGVGYFFEPEYTRSARAGRQPPYSSLLGEQYALAALLYLLVTGKHYVDFSLEKHEMLRQISEDGPLAFSAGGIDPWPDVEEILVKALDKDPAARFKSVAAFANALRNVDQTPSSVKSPDIGPVSYATATGILARILQRLDVDAPLFRSGLAAAPKASVTYGSAGVACALHRIACARQDAKILSLADIWGERAARDTRLEDAWYCPEIEITSDVVGRVSPYHTESGVPFIQSLIAHSMGDVITQQNALGSFVAAASRTPCDNLDLTLGRSGVLLAASHLYAAADPSLGHFAALRDLGDSTLASIWQQFGSYAPIPECHQIRYTGIAHGWAGMLYATLCWCRATGADLPAETGERLSQLAALAHHSGRQAKWNWTVANDAGEAHSPFWGGWCNGTAGQVFLWLAAQAALKDDRYSMLAEKAAWHAAETDTRNSSLCCGFPGQAYALLALYRSSGERSWLHRAQALAEKAALPYAETSAGRASEEFPFRPNSLYKGELGVAVLAADLECPDVSALPAFELAKF